VIPSGPGGGHLDDTLSAFLDDELAPAARHEAEAHLAGCSECRAELDEVAAAAGPSGSCPSTPPPGRLVGGGAFEASPWAALPPPEARPVAAVGSCGPWWRASRGRRLPAAP